MHLLTPLQVRGCRAGSCSEARLKNKHLWHAIRFASPRRPAQCSNQSRAAVGCPAGGRTPSPRPLSRGVHAALPGLAIAGEGTPALPGTTAKPGFSRTPVASADLVLPRILLHQHHPQAVCLHTPPGQSLEKHSKKKPGSRRLTGPRFVPLRQTPWVMPLRSPGLARPRSAAKTETNAKHEVSRTESCRARGEGAAGNEVPVSPLRAHST